MSNPSKAPRRCLYLCCGVSALLLLGCGEEEQIRSYKVPKEPTVAERPVAKSEDGRLIAAIFAQPDRTYYVKLLGPATLAKEHEAEFQEFLRTVRFGDKAGIEWKAPAGWEAFDADDRMIRSIGGERHGVFHIGTKERYADIDITSFPGAFTKVLLNVNRWRDQVGLKPVSTEAEAEKAFQKTEINGKPVLMVDLSGTAVNRRPMMSR
jgi:hypothetical protein